MSNGNNDTPNWDKIAEGKVRHGFAIEAFKKGMTLARDTMKEVDRWVYFVIHGLDGIERILEAGILDSDKKLDDDEVMKAITDKFDGEVLNGTEEEHIAGKINSAIEGLSKTDANKVLRSLKEGRITLANLDTCLTRIKTMKQRD